MVRSHARRSGISSVDDLESESVSTEHLPNTDVARVDPEDHIQGIQDVIDKYGRGTVIELGDGEYVGSELTLDHGIHLVGAGRESTTIKLEDGVNTDLIVTPDVDTRNVRRVVMRDLEVDGNKDNNNTGNGVYGSFWNGRFIDCQFRFAPERNFWAAGSSAASTDDNVFRGCRFIQAGTEEGNGLTIGQNKVSGAASGVAHVHNCFFGNNHNAAIFARGNAMKVTASKFYGNAEGSDGSTLLFDRCRHLWALGNDFGTTDINASHVSITARNGVDVAAGHVKNNSFRNQYQEAVQAYADGENITGLQVHDNIFHSNENGQGQAVDGIDAFGIGAFAGCSAKNNTFINGFSGSETSLPTGWTETGTITTTEP